jgi:bifunctional non-homologous end joining protein LigD
MPLTWNQVKADLDPARFTIATVPQLLKQTTAWSDYFDARRSLEAAITALAPSF